MTFRSARTLALGAVAALAAAGGALPATSARASEITLAIASDPDALDPTLSGTSAGRQVFAALCDKLVEIDPKMNYVPALATSWDWSDDAKTLTLHLRAGVTFHDGTPFDAEAVAYNIKRHQTMQGSNRKSEISPIASVEMIDPLTVALHLSAPSSPLIAALADRAGMMVSPTAAEKAGEDFAKNPVCAGPYKFVERVPQDRIVLEKYEGYYDAAAYPIDKITYLPITDSTTRLANLRSGQIQILESVSPADVATLQKEPGVKVVKETGLSSYYFVFNIAGGESGQSKTPISQDPKLREAVEASIDRKILNQVANDGMFTVGNQPSPPSSPWYIKEFPVPERDVAKARALVAQVKGKPEFTVLIPASPTYQRYAQIIQSMASEAGIKINIEAQEVTTLLSNWSTGNFQAILIRWSGRTDPDGNIYSFKACAGPRNGSKYCNPELDKWLDESRVRSSYEDRYEAYKNAAAIYLADRPYLYLFHGVELTGLRDEVKDFQPYPDGLFRLKGVSVE